MKIHIYPKSMLETVWQQDKLLFTPEAEQPPLCLRCGQPLDHRLVINALSRYADVHICEACGMDEALRDANRCPLPLTEWAAVKNGLSQQQTDFEAPLLTTSCTFEDLFQQGSRPASEIAYSRSDYGTIKALRVYQRNVPYLPNTLRPTVIQYLQLCPFPKCPAQLIQIFDHAIFSFPRPTGQSCCAV